jgi:hypothetical protein
VQLPPSGAIGCRCGDDFPAWQVAWQSRLVAVGAAGEEKVPTGETNSGERMEWHFSDVKTSDLKQWRFQVRPFEWIEFRDIALTPRQNP